MNKTLIKVDGKIVGELYDSDILIDIPENSEVNVPLNESSNVGYKSISDNYIRAKPSKEQKVAFST